MPIEKISYQDPVLKPAENKIFILLARLRYGDVARALQAIQSAQQNNLAGSTSMRDIRLQSFEGLRPDVTIDDDIGVIFLAPVKRIE